METEILSFNVCEWNGNGIDEQNKMNMRKGGGGVYDVIGLQMNNM